MWLRRFLTDLVVFFGIKTAVDLGLRPLLPDSNTDGWLRKALVWAVVMATIFAAFPNLFNAKPTPSK